MQPQQSKSDISPASASSNRIQTLAMCLYGHLGFDGSRTCVASQPPIAAFVPAKLEYSGSIPVPPTPHLLKIVDMEALMLAADIDAGEEHTTLSPNDVILNYSGATGSFDITWEMLKSTQYLPQENVWVVDGRMLRLLHFVEAPAPQPFSPYSA